MKSMKVTLEMKTGNESGCNDGIIFCGRLVFNILESFSPFCAEHKQGTVYTTFRLLIESIIGSVYLLVLARYCDGSTFGIMNDDPIGRT